MQEYTDTTLSTRDHLSLDEYRIHADKEASESAYRICVCMCDCMSMRLPMLGEDAAACWQETTISPVSVQVFFVTLLLHGNFQVKKSPRDLLS